jgi:hypothetical protein
MRVNLIFATIILLQNTVYSQSELAESERNLIKSQGIRVKEQWDYKYSGNVVSGKGFVSSRTTFDKDGRVVEVVNYKSDTAVLDLSIYAYNSDGDRTDFTKYRGNKSSLIFKQSTQYRAPKLKSLEIGFNGVDEFRNQYNYNGSGKLTEIKYFTGKKLDEVRSLSYSGNETTVQVKDANGNILSYLKSRYDEKGRVTEETKLDKDQKITDQIYYSYDSKGNLLVEEKKSPMKKTVRTEYIYDRSGKVQEVYYDGGEVPKYLKQSYSFASNGFLTGEFWKNSPTAEQSFRKYNYDSKGRLLSTDCYFASYKYKVLNKFVYQSY